ncbi:MAG: hypothetical protein MHPDNHAH_01753 [Anaerolineales bacterium]|nr:hypothetical protein [Anaerolineales bacterium]
MLIVLILLACRILIRDEIFMDSQARRYPDVFFESYSSNGAVRFDANTILSDIKQGKGNIFIAIDAALAEPRIQSQFAWKQSDYLMIANALHQFVWNESLDGWDFHDMSLYGECESKPMDFSNVYVSYYKPTGLQEYSAHMIGIYPLAGEGEWGGDDRFPRSIFRKWEYINLDKLIKVREALQIAEASGGELARSTVKNQCRISMGLGPYPYPAWRVSYTMNGSVKIIFDIEIDAYSGEYKIILNN